MNLMLLCAGQGTRFNPYTLKRPKPAIPMLGVPMLFWSLEHAMHLHPSTIVCNVSHLANQVEALIEVAAIRLQKEIQISRETPLPFESGGGLRHARALLDPQEEILLCNADEVALFDDPKVLQEFYHFHQQQNSFATLLTMHNPLVGSKFGGVWAKDSSIFGFGKEPIEGTKGWHYLGMMILNPKIMQYLPDRQSSNIIYDGLVNALSAGEKLCHYPTQGLWFETGNIQDYLLASQALAKEVIQNTKHGRLISQLRTRWLGADSTHILSSSSHQGSTAGSTQVLCEEVISPEVLSQFSGINVVGRNCHFAKGIQISNSVICSGANVLTNVSEDLVL